MLMLTIDSIDRHVFPAIVACCWEVNDTATAKLLDSPFIDYNQVATGTPMDNQRAANAANPVSQNFSFPAHHESIRQNTFVTEAFQDHGN